jgi:hypothetical protein
MSARPGPRPGLPNGAPVGSEPLRIRVDQRHHAAVLTRNLASLGSVEVRARGPRWEISLHGPKSDRVVNRALDAVRRTLAGEPSVVADVLLDGQVYRMHGE